MFGDDKYSVQYHDPLVVLDDGRILVWVDKLDIRTKSIRS